MIKLRLSLLTALLTVASLPALAWAQSLTVISNPAVSITSDDVRDIFMGEKQVAGGVKLTPVDNASAQANFLSKVVKVDASKYAAVWTKKAFREGLVAPATKGTDQEVIDFVKRTPGGVGYIKATSAPGVKVVTQVP